MRGAVRCHTVTSMLVLLIFVTSKVLAQHSLLGHHGLNSDSCSLATITDRADAVDAVCCNAADRGPDSCEDGVPTNCDFDCSAVYVPFFDECQAIIQQIAVNDIDTYSTLYSKCTHLSSHDMLRRARDLDEEGCTLSMPSKLTALGCAGSPKAKQWRITIDAVGGGGNQVQLDEAAFSDGKRQLGMGKVAPVISPGITNGDDRVEGPILINNGEPTTNDQSNCDPLPCSYTYTFGKPQSPTHVVLAYADSPDRCVYFVYPV